MHVLLLREGVEQSFVGRQVRHDAQLDLRIVRSHKNLALRCNEGLANAPAFFGADRNVLQVRVG